MGLMVKHVEGKEVVLTALAFWNTTSSSEPVFLKVKENEEYVTSWLFYWYMSWEHMVLDLGGKKL